jgi:GNAT superfamily N-acetyltransferase
MCIYKEIEDKNRNEIMDFVTHNWGAPIMVTRGKVHNMDKLPGFISEENGNINGLITYSIADRECEIVSLDSLSENKGIGSRLIELVVERARVEKCRRVWLITTNDNTKAIRFYQKRGFDMAAFYLNSVELSRKIKPEIPKTGNDGIPILHEIEMEYKL